MDTVAIHESFSRRFKQKKYPKAERLFSAVKKLYKNVKNTKSARSLKDHWMKVVSLGAISAGVYQISHPVAFIVFGILFFGLEGLVGE